MGSGENSQKIPCRTPANDCYPTPVDGWKFEVIHNAILSVLEKEKGRIVVRKLPNRVRKELSRENLKKLGSVTWYTATVKLEMEVRGEIRCVAGARPQIVELVR